MIKAIAIMPRRAVAAIKEDILENKLAGSCRQWDNIFCISINGTAACEGIEGQPLFTIQEILQNSCPPDLKTKNWETSRILHLEFDDIMPDTVARYESCKDMEFMSVTQATDTIRFLKHWNDIPGDAALIVHCQAGISRSGAVGKFAGWLFGIEDKVLKANPGIAPNSWVENLLYAAYKGM